MPFAYCCPKLFLATELFLSDVLQFTGFVVLAVKCQCMALDTFQGSWEEDLKKKKTSAFDSLVLPFCFCQHGDLCSLHAQKLANLPISYMLSRLLSF